MKTKKELTCIGCPMGCPVTVEINNGAIESITGYTCPHGRDYAETEVTRPVRTVTSTVPVDGGVYQMAPVKTAGDIPKDKIADCMALIHGARLRAPVRAGDVVIRDVAGTGVDLIATRFVGVTGRVQ